MIIRCWGARGSIPVSGNEFLKYGGDTACLELRTKNDEVIVIDAGTGLRRLGARLLREGRSQVHMIFTHAHWDHLAGFPFFKPLYNRDTEITIYGDPLSGYAMRDILAGVMSAPTFPVGYSVVAPRLQYRRTGDEAFVIDSISVVPIELSHPGGGKGYLFREDETTFVFLTDNELIYNHFGGHSFETYRDFCAGADLLIHDAEFVPDEYGETRRWGHSVFTDALELAREAGVQRFGLFHHNQDRHDEAIDAMVKECRSVVRDDGTDMDCFALTQDWELVL